MKVLLAPLGDATVTVLQQDGQPIGLEPDDIPTPSGAIRVGGGTSIINGVFSPPNDLLVGPFTVPPGFAARPSVFIRDGAGVATYAWGDPTIIPTASFMWHFQTVLGQPNQLQLHLINNSGGDGVQFDWAVYIDPIA